MMFSLKSKFWTALLLYLENPTKQENYADGETIIFSER